MRALSRLPAHLRLGHDAEHIWALLAGVAQVESRRHAQTVARASGMASIGPRRHATPQARGSRTAYLRASAAAEVQEVEYQLARQALHHQ
jgi:hypothetical protein